MYFPSLITRRSISYASVTCDTCSWLQWMTQLWKLASTCMEIWSWPTWVQVNASAPKAWPVSKFFYFFFWTAEDKIPENKTGGGYHPQAYSRIMICLFFAIQDQVNTCVLMQWSNQNLTWFLQGNSPRASLQGSQVIKFYGRKKGVKMHQFFFLF